MGKGRQGRRGNGEGTITQRRDGRWEARYWQLDGRRKVLYEHTRQDVARRLAEAIRDRDKGLPQRADERLRLRAFLDEWLAGRTSSLRPRSQIRYRELLAHVSRALGDHLLTRLTPRGIQRLYSDLQAAAPAGAGLSSTTAHQIHVVLRQALATAERHGLVARNPADLVDAPRIAQTEMRVYDLAQARALLTAARDDRLEALYVLALTTGMREGELLGLRWRDVDLERAAAHVRATLSWIPRHGFRLGQPKTRRSRRRIDLSAEAVAALRRHKARQAQEKLASGLGPLWGAGAIAPDLIFTTPTGGPMDGRHLARRSYHRLLARAGLPIIRFHDLRHTAATLMLLQGVHPKIVSERLGHASIAITLDRYSHVLPSMQMDAAKALDAALFG